MDKRYSYTKSAIKLREHLKSEYNAYYFNQWYNKIIVEGADGSKLDYNEVNYIKSKLFYDGRVAIFKRVDGLPAFCPFSVNEWGMYDQVTSMQLINERNVKGVFPNNLTGVNGKDFGIFYITPKKIGIKEMIRSYIDRMVEIDMTIYINLFAQKSPIIAAVAPQDKHAIKEITNKILDDELVIFADFKQIEKVSALNIGANFNIDKLQMEKDTIVNELKTILGIDNNNINKKERAIVDEVNANNDIIANSGNVFINTLNENSKIIKSTLGFDIRFRWDSSDLDEVEENEEKEEENELDE